MQQTLRQVLAVSGLALFVGVTALGAQAPAPGPAPAATAQPPAADAAARVPPADRRPRPAPPRESLRAIRERGILRACVAPNAPWMIEGPEGSRPTGFTIDVATQLAEDIGVELELVRTSAAGLIAAVFEGDCDVIPGGLAATPDRALFLHFSAPIAAHDVEAVGAAGTATSLDATTTTIGAVEGSAELQDARRTFTKATIRTFASQAELGDALLKRELQVAVAAAPFAEVAEKLSSGAVASLGTPLARRRESMAVRRGDLEFLAYLDTWVQARTDEGWLAARKAAWFDRIEWLTPAAPGQ